MLPNMRIMTPFLCLLLCGCSARITRQEIIDATGSNRLARIDRRIASLANRFQNRQAYDFDSLVWSTQAGGTWHDRVVISQAAFQAGSPRRRWISEIYSLDPTNGTCIIKVAEGDAPEGAPSVRYVYSWREWSLLSNTEVRVVRVCASPFEAY